MSEHSSCQRESWEERKEELSHTLRVAAKSSTDPSSTKPFSLGKVNASQTFPFLQSQKDKHETWEGEEAARKFYHLLISGIFQSSADPCTVTDRKGQATTQGSHPQDSPEPKDKLGSPGMQKQPPMCAPSSQARPLGTPAREHREETASQRCPSSRLLPITEGPRPAQHTMQSLISWLQQEAREGGRGSPTCRHQSPALSGL